MGIKIFSFKKQLFTLQNPKKFRKGRTVATDFYKLRKQ